MWNLKKNDICELIYKTDTDSQTYRTSSLLPKEKGVGRDNLEVWDQQIQTTIHIIDKQQILMYNTGNYTQYLVINYNGK